MSRSVHILGRKLPLIPLLLASLLTIGAIAQTTGFINRILSPYQQVIHETQDEFIVGEAPEYVESILDIEGEEMGSSLILGSIYSLTLRVSHTRTDYDMNGLYTLTITGPTTSDEVLYGQITGLKFGDTFTKPVAWSPSETGQFTTTLSIIEMSWFETFYATFTDIVYEAPTDTLALRSHTLPLGISLSTGSTVDFDYTLESVLNGTWIGWLYDIEVSTDQVAWTTIVSAGKVWENGAILIDSFKPTKTVDADFSVPATVGDYYLKLVIYDLRKTDQGEPGT